MSVISRSGIASGQIIKSEHLLRVIKALDGTDITDIIVTGSLTSNTFIGNLTGSVLGTATTASVLSPGNKTINGDLVVTGKITAEEYHNEFISSSIVYKSGSTKFGNSSDDVHSFTGSLQSPAITGSLLGNASTSTSASYALTASHFNGSVVSSSYALSSSYSVNSSTAVTASYVLSSSYSTNSNNAVSASYALTASYFSGSITNAISASYSLSSSYAVTASYFSGSISDAISASYALTASYARNATSASYFSGSISNAVSASYALTASYLEGNVNAFPYTGSAGILGTLDVNGSVTASYFKGDGSALTGIIGEWDGTLDGDGEITGSLKVTNGITGSLLGSATSATSASYALSSSYSVAAHTLTTGDKTINGDLIVTGNVTAQEFNTEFVSSSIIYQSGSTKFGDTSDDVMSVTGSLQVLGSITGSLLGNASTSTTASYALTASYYNGSVVSASYANNATSASYSNNSTSSSYALSATSASYALSSSYSRNTTSASYALNGGVTSIVAGTNVTITNGGSGSVTINSSGGSSVRQIYQVTLNMSAGNIDTAGTPIASVLGPNGENKTSLEADGWSFSTTTNRLTVGRPTGFQVRPLIGIMAHGYKSSNGGYWSKPATGIATNQALAAIQNYSGGYFTGLDLYGVTSSTTGAEATGTTQVIITFEMIN